MADSVRCPGCGQAWVRHFRVRELERDIYLCGECETMWLSRDEIGEESPTSFSDFMRQQGLRAVWSEIEEISE
jgi:hypothetical protein